MTPTTDRTTNRTTNRTTSAGTRGGSRRRASILPPVLLVLATLTAVVTACSGDQGPSFDARSTGTAPEMTSTGPVADETFTLTTQPTGDLVYASGPTSFLAIDRGSGDRRYERPASLLAADGSDLFTTEVVGDTTSIVASDPQTGEARWSTSLQGAFVGRVVGPRGRQLALSPAETATAPADEHAIARSRQRSSIVVASTAGGLPVRFDLDGNYESEAFSVDGTGLYVVKFSPAVNPDQYRVQRLDLKTGAVDDVYGRNKELQGDMPGRSRTFVTAPDGHARYTLYTMTMPPGGHDPAGGHPPGPPHAPGETHALVHVLDLQNYFAHCVDLPAPFGLQDPEGLAIAASPNGAWFVVADTDTGIVGIIDATSLEVVTQIPVDRMAGGQTTMAAMDDGQLVIARGTDVQVVNTAGAATRHWKAPGEVDGMTIVPGTALVYLSSAGHIWAYDLAGHPQGEVGTLT